MSDNRLLIDAYAHVGMPRFQSVADYEGVMARAGIGRAVLCSFDSSPDLAAIHTAISRSPDKFRGLGVLLGKDREEMESVVRAQLAAGFSGLRLTDEDVVERSWLLDILAAEDRIAIVCGQPSSDSTARALLANFERNPDAIVIGGHFAGVDNPRILAYGPAAMLFAHPRFYVVFSRHGGFPPAAVLTWAEAVVARTGWSRLLGARKHRLCFGGPRPCLRRSTGLGDCRRRRNNARPFTAAIVRRSISAGRSLSGHWSCPSIPARGRGRFRQRFGQTACRWNRHLRGGWFTPGLLPVEREISVPLSRRFSIAVFRRCLNTKDKSVCVYADQALFRPL